MPVVAAAMRVVRLPLSSTRTARVSGDARPWEDGAVADVADTTLGLPHAHGMRVCKR